MTVTVLKLRNHPSGAMLMVLQFAALFQMAQFSFTANNQCKDRMLSLLFNDTCYELTQLEWCHSDNTINNSKCTEIVQRQHVCAQPRNSDEDVNYTMACDSGYELLTQDGYLIEGAQVDICVNVSWKTDFNVSIRDHSCFTRNDTNTILDSTSDSTSITLTLVQLFETRNSNCGNQITRCVLYSAYCQAHHSDVQHGTKHQCYSNSTNCTIAITELQPNTTYQCCLHDIIISEESLHRINISTKFKVTITGPGPVTSISTDRRPQEYYVQVIPLYFVSGLLFLLLIAMMIVSIVVCRRMRKVNISLTRELAEFEMTSKYNARRDSSDRYLAIKKRDSNRKQPLYPPAQADDYLTPISLITPTEERTRTEMTRDILEPKDSEEKTETEINILEHIIEERSDSETEIDTVIEPKEESSETEMDTVLDPKEERSWTILEPNEERSWTKIDLLRPKEPVEATEGTSAAAPIVEKPYQSLIRQKSNTVVSNDGYVKLHSHSFSVLDRSSPPRPPPLPPKPEPVSPLDLAIPQLKRSLSENTYGNCPKPLKQ